MVILVSIRLVVVILTVLIPPRTLRLPDKCILAAEIVEIFKLVDLILEIVALLEDK